MDHPPVTEPSPPAAAEIPPDVLHDLERTGISLAPPALQNLARYLDFLLNYNQRVNLTAVRDRKLAWRRLILDSLTLLPHLADSPDGARLIDVGSGGGVPGIPIAIARPGFHVTLLETTGKKAKFLQLCVDQLPLASTRVIQGRAETLGQDPQHRQQYNAALCRGVGPMNRILEYTLPLLRVGGRFLTIKGASDIEKELEDASDALTILGAGHVEVLEAYPPDVDPDSVIVRVTKDRPTPKAYPRQPGTPEQSPL